MNIDSECPSSDRLRQFVFNELSSKQVARVEAHLEQCDACLHRLDRIEAETDIDRQILGGLVKEPGETRGYDHRSIVQEALNSPEFTDKYTLLEQVSRNNFRVRSFSTREECVACFPDVSAEQLNRLGKLTLKMPLHPNLASVIDLDHCRRIDYFVMPWIEGEDLISWCHERPLSEIVPLFETLVKDLDSFHSAGFVHGGITGSRVLIRAEQPVLIDFGVHWAEAKRDDDALALVELFESALEVSESPERVNEVADHTLRTGDKFRPWFLDLLGDFNPK